MVNKILISVIAVFLVFQTVSCKKNSNSCHWAAEPPVFFFQIKKNGIVLADSVFDGIKIYYLSKNNKKYISDLSPATDVYANKGILTSRQIGTFESELFFIEYPDNSGIDTLLMQNLMPSPSTNCSYKVELVKFNDSIAAADTSFGYPPVYVFLK